MLSHWWGIAIAQTNPDSSYYQPHSLQNNAKLYVGSFERQIRILPSKNNTDGGDYHFSPNSSMFVGASGQYKKLFLFVEAAVPGTHKVSPQENNVRGYGIFLSKFQAGWGITGFFSYNNGLLMQTPGMMPYAPRHDIKMVTTGFHYYHFFNGKKFSYPVAAAALANQKKSAGSFALMITPSARWMSSKDGIVPMPGIRHHFKGYDESLENLNLFGLQVKPGYVHNFLLGKKGWYIAPMLFAGVGADWHVLKTNMLQDAGINFNKGYRAKIVGGYNGPKFFATVDLLTDYTQSYLYKSKVQNRYSEGSINLGFRF